ncbi:hypothetical protein GCM10010987_12350 [Bradyrhizobium guangdongense]|uniref:Uncharacterized protein n=1 Tax=Bradyrhizobium guangdongense TaxID=1325090 RepID=A0AA87W0M7_9BRAD|nr:hypothetical protein GCM10010987_12350 [Bradyrhizobium guangdongense]
MSPGYRYFAPTQQGAPAQLGVYLPDYNGDLSLYWRGQVGREEIRSLIEETETVLLKAGQKVSATLEAYGVEAKDPDKTEIHLGPMSETLAETLSPKSNLPSFGACRAELTVAAGKVIIWANVTGDKTAALEEGGENIGVSVPQSLFREGIRPVIEHAISATMKLKPNVAKVLINEITNAIQTRRLRPS